MSAWELPRALRLGDKDYAIRTDFRAVLDILTAANDPDLDDYAKTEVMLMILYQDPESIPAELMDEAVRKACEFIDCGQKDDRKPHVRTIDWQQDGALIIPAVNSVAHTEIRALDELHWWTFFSWFMEIRESLFSSVLSIRQKKAGHKPLEKWEQDFYRENKNIIDLKTPETEESRAEKENIMNYL